MSFFMLGGEMARALGPLLAVAAVAWWGLEGIYRLVGIGVVASIVLYLRTREIGELPSAQKQNHTSLREAWGRLARVMLPLAGFIAARAFINASLTAYLPTLLVDEGAEVAVGGAMLSAVEFAGAIGALASGTLSDRMGQRRVLSIVAVAAPALMLGFLFTQGALSTLMLLTLGFVTISTTPVMMALVQEQGRDYPATANGIYMAINFLLRSGIVIVIGAMGDAWGLRAAFQVSGVLGVAALPFVLMLPREAKES